jgi:hypothetical protein
VSDNPKPVMMMARAMGIKTTDRKLACMRKFLNLASAKIKELLDLSTKNIRSIRAATLLPVHRGEECGIDEHERSSFISGESPRFIPGRRHYRRTLSPKN